jgi:hypothetical protein
MPIGSTVVYNSGDLILSTVSSSGVTFQENKIAAATSSIILFNSNGLIGSQSLNSTTVGTASYVSSSNIVGTVTSASYASSASYALSSSLATTAGALVAANNYTVNNLTASNINIGNNNNLSIGTSNQFHNIYLQKPLAAGSNYQRLHLGTRWYWDFTDNVWTASVQPNVDNPDWTAIDSLQYLSFKVGNVTGSVTSLTTSSYDSNERFRISIADVRVFNSGSDAEFRIVENDFVNNPKLTFYNATTPKWAIGVDAADSDKFKINKGALLNTTNVITINASSNVGIGTTNPSNPLSVVGAASFGTYASTTAPANGIIVSGNVGIGSSNPANKLDVAGNISCSVITASLFFGTASVANSLNPTNSYSITNLTASNISASSFTGSVFGTSSWSTNALTASSISTTGNAFVQGGNSFGATATIGTNDANSLVLETNNTAQLTINSGGRIGIGVGVTPAYKLNISDTHVGSLGSASIAISTTQNQNTADSGNDTGIYNVYAVSNFTSSTLLQNQAIYNSLQINGSGSFSGSYRAARHGVLLSNSSSLEANSSFGNTYFTNQISQGIPNFNIPSWYLGTYIYSDLITGNTTGSIGNTYGHHIGTPFSTGAGGINITNSYAVYIARQKTANVVTNGYGIYQQYTGDLNIFAGKTLIGSTTAPVNNLDVVGAVAIGATYAGTNTAPVSGLIVQGNVGIGTTNPANKLDVAGNISASTITASLFFGTSSVANALNPANSYQIANLTASNISASSFTGSHFGTSSWATNSLTAALATSINFTASNATTSQTASYLTPANSYTVANLTATSTISASNLYASQYIYPNNDIAFPQKTSGSYSGFSSNPAGGAASVLELIQCLSNAIGVNDPLRFRTVSSPEYFSASAWFADANPPPYGKLIDGNASNSTQVITYNDSSSLSISAKRFVVSFGAYSRPNFITVQSDYGGNFYGYSLGIEKQSASVWLPAVTTQTVANNDARLLAFQLGDLSNTDALRFTFTSTQTITSGTYLLINNIRSYSNQNYSSTIPVYTNSGSQFISTNNVGIGSVAPKNKLDVVGNISCSVITASLFSGSLSGSVFGTSSWSSNSLTASNLALQTSYTITNANSIAASLEVTGPANISGTFAVLPSSGDNTASVFTVYGDSSPRVSRFTVTREGKVGVGTTNPVNKLEIVGNISCSVITASNFFGTSSWATNALTAALATSINFTASNAITSQTASYLTPANSYTVANLTASNISASTITASNMIVNGNLTVTGSIFASLFSASNIYITSSTLVVTDNIITINALSPYQRYAGLEMYDSGSGTLSSFLWDSVNNYFFVSSSDAGASRQIILGPTGEASLTANYIPLISGSNNLTSSVIYQSGSNIGIGTTTPLSKFVVNGGTVNTSSYTTSEARIADGTLHLMKTVAGGVFESIRAMNMDTTAGTTVRVLAASTSDPFNNANGGKVFIDAIRTSTNMDLAFSLNDVAGAAAVERVRFMGSGNVGIGTTNPVNKLDVVGNISCSAITASNFTGGTFTPTNIISSGTIIYKNAVLLDYSSSALATSQSNYVVLQNLTGSYNSAFFDYFASSASNFRAGTVIAGWSGNNITYTEYATTDVGTTNQLTMSAAISASYIQLLGNAASSLNWNIKSSGRYI